MVTIEKATKLVKLARKAIETKEIEYTKDKEKSGVFVTLSTYPEHELRGCIGYSEPTFSVNEGIQRAAVCAAYSDPRFPPLEKEELDKIVVEISVLTKSNKIEAKDAVKKLSSITPNKDGLIINYKNRSALLLPQVWEELSSKEEFLNALCLKCMLPYNAWMDPNANIFKFNVEAFKEITPNGRIVKVKT